jgi:hypothetical protein
MMKIDAMTNLIIVVLRGAKKKAKVVFKLHKRPNNKALDSPKSIQLHCACYTCNPDLTLLLD